MTMNKIIAKLRKKNKGQYTILGVCILLSVLLVTAFAFMYLSPTVQDFLPEGGDTRKLALLMLGTTMIGCTIFTIYGANLFYKYKSREFGVLLALGERKRKLSRWLLMELGVVIGRYTALGLLLAVPVSVGIWNLFRLLVISTDEMRYRFGAAGLVVGILYAVFLTLCILLTGVRFIRRANIMDILNEQRKTEMVKEIRPWAGKAGIILIIAGLLLAMGVPPVIVTLTMTSLPAIWNATYLLSVAGLYLLMLSAVGHSRRGKHPEKYYKNIISTNLMRFTARQTTRNMCVITMLIFVLLIASFWGAMYYNSAFASSETAPADYSMHYPMEEQQITRSEIEALAEKHQTEITSYEEAEALVLIINYQNTDFDESGNKYFDVTAEKLACFLSATDFSRISGEPADVETGEYLTVVAENYKETIWVGPDCLNEIQNPVTKEKMQVQFKDTVAFNNMTEMSDPFTFVLSDQDYENLAVTMGQALKERMVFFNVKDVMDTYGFALDLKNSYIARATQLSDHLGLYDAYEEAQATERGKEYGYGGKAGLSPDNSQLMGDWKYAPFSKVLSRADAMQLIAIFVLLSVYIAIISLTSVGIMSYVRSITIAMDNKRLFDDLKKLGANKTYVERVIRMQLHRIFSYPALAGSIIVFLFSIFMTYFNDMSLQAFELRMLGVEALMIVLVCVFMYVMYLVSFRKMKKIIEL